MAEDYDGKIEVSQSQPLLVHERLLALCLPVFDVGTPQRYSTATAVPGQYRRTGAAEVRNALFRRSVLVSHTPRTAKHKTVRSFAIRVNI